jgi:hypothetical protein
MQSNVMLGKQPRHSGRPSIVPAIEPKRTTLKTLAQLKAKLYANAARAIQQNPAKAEIIQKRVDADAAHLRFAINMVQIKM